MMKIMCTASVPVPPNHSAMYEYMNMILLKRLPRMCNIIIITDYP